MNHEKLSRFLGEWALVVILGFVAFKLFFG